MDNREIIKELIEDEIKKLKKHSFDRYDSDEDKRAFYLAILKQDKLRKINECLSSNKSITNFSEIIPDWKNVIQELLEEEMKRLEEADYAKANDCVGADRYDSDEEKMARSSGHAKYLKIKSMKEKLENDRKQQSRVSILPKKETAFLDER